MSEKLITTRNRVVAKQSRCEGVYNRTGDLSVTCFGKEERRREWGMAFSIKKPSRTIQSPWRRGAGGPELRSAFVCSANLRFIDLWFSSTLFYIKITNRKSDWLFLVGAGGFEPPKSSTTDLQSAPFGHSGTLPHKFILFSQNNGAGGRTWTPDLLLTNQLLYQLSYTSIFQRLTNIP